MFLTAGPPYPPKPKTEEGGGEGAPPGALPYARTPAAGPVPPAAGGWSQGEGAPPGALPFSAPAALDNRPQAAAG